MKQGWLVNDTLTCILGTKTLWHDLLEWMPNLVDKTNGYTDFRHLADVIESQATTDRPDYIVRNASYFRKLNVDSFTISLMQDPFNGGQLDVLNSSDVVVFNSEYMRQSCINQINPKKETVIPLGVDFDFFRPLGRSFRKELGIPERAILFIGADNKWKGFDRVRWLIDNTDLNFCLVMKDGISINNDRCVTFNSVDHSTLLKIINSCSVCLCTSVMETQHLSSIEAGACGLPVITTNVGIHYGKEGSQWGEKIPDGSNVEDIQDIILKALGSQYETRERFIEFGYDKISCQNSWSKLL
jgi:glycosyltransferase involved in cell wall biosynthesis|tara:strand:+ start:33 stop:929 length:897 start_codon:yes stop_codon:yes gene_type:complete